MLELEPLLPEALRQVYEWDGPHAEPFESYAARLSRPSWAHYAIADGDTMIGCVSMQLIGPDSCTMHVTMQPKAARLAELRDLILNLGGHLFNSGFRAIRTEICKKNRAAKILATLCWMRKTDADERYQRFIITSEDYYGRRRQETTL